jgi:hypothetical protein
LCSTWKFYGTTDSETKTQKEEKSVQNKDTSGSVSSSDIQVSVTSTTDTPIRNTQDSSETDIGTVLTSYMLHYNPKHFDEPVCYRCGQTGHIAAGCRVITHPKRRPHYDQKSRKRAYVHQRYTPSSTTYNKKLSLTVESNEVPVKVFNIETIALLDTGSTFSTISETFSKKHFPEIPLQSLDFALTVECADAQPLPYSG